MNALDLADAGSGIADPVFESQSAFRGCLSALATPGTIVSLGAGSLAASPAEADFALVADAGELPPLDAFSVGSQEYPERSATIVLQVPAILESGWRLSGPGIRGEARLSIPSLGDAFVRRWERNRARFPRGVDLYVCSGDRLCGLPRTTRIET